MSHSKSLEQGEVWLVELGQTRGAEMEKTRPAIVLSDDNTGVLPLRVVVPPVSASPEARRPAPRSA